MKKESNVLMWVLLILLPPIGIIYMWAAKKNVATKTKIILSVVFGLYSLLFLLVPSGSSDQPASTSGTEPNTSVESESDSETTESEHKPITTGTYTISGEDFSFTDNVINDSTGKWRLTRIASQMQPQDYAVEYYKTLFSSDDEVHCIINFSLNTTTCIRVLVPGMLIVDIYEYVDKEEHDAKKMFTGMQYAEYTVDIDSGKIEKIFPDNSASLSDSNESETDSIEISNPFESQTQERPLLSNDSRVGTYLRILVAEISCTDDSLKQLYNYYVENIDIYEYVVIDFGIGDGLLCNSQNGTFIYGQLEKDTTTNRYRISEEKGYIKIDGDSVVRNTGNEYLDN